MGSGVTWISWHNVPVQGRPTDTVRSFILFPSFFFADWRLARNTLRPSPLMIFSGVLLRGTE